MGGGSSHFEPNPDVVGHSRSVLVTALELGYSAADVDVMHRKFCNLDYHRTGVVKIIEYLVSLNVPYPVFASILLSPFDSTHSGAFTFEEFLVSCWNVLTMSEINFAKFVFQLFDVEKTGDLTVLEITELIAIVCANPECSKYLQIEFKSVDVAPHDDMTFDQFFTLVKKTPLLLFPVYQVRDKLRSITLGTTKWSQITARKNKTYGDHSMTDILGSMIQKPGCYTGKSLSYFHTSTMIRSVEAEKYRAASLAKKEKERKEKRKNKSQDVRDAEKHLNKYSTDSNDSLRKSGKGRTTTTMRRNSMGNQVTKSSFNLHINSTRNNTTRLPNNMDTSDTKAKKNNNNNNNNNNSNSNIKLNSNNNSIHNTHNNQTDGNTATNNAQSTSSSRNIDRQNSNGGGDSPHKPAPRRKSLGSTGGKITGGVFSSDDPLMKRSTSKKSAARVSCEFSRPIIIKRTESRTILM